jgi:glycerol-3-phosphate dehydrogenase
MLSRREVIALEPSLDAPGLSGGMLFYDALMYSPERLTLEVVTAARAAGAITANHVEFVAPVLANGRIAGARLRHALDGHEAEIRTRWIVNATGSSVPALAARFASRPAAKPQEYSVALSFVTRQPARRVAFAVSAGPLAPGRPQSGRARQLFVVPWRGQTMVGTAHLEYRGDPAAFELMPEHVERFTEEIATARPALPLVTEEIALVHAGLLPVADAARDPLRLLDRHRIIDHAAEGCAGALSVITVKFTTARQVARDIVDRIAPERGPETAAAGRIMPLPGGVFHSLGQLRSSAEARFGALLPADVLEHLVRTYGARYEDVLEHRRHLTTWDQRVVPNAPIIRAQLMHGVLAEHARTAGDLLWRRTEIGPRGLVTDAALRMAEETLAGIRPHDPNRSMVV